MPSQDKERRERAERRGTAERRARKTAVAEDRRKGSDRRSGLARRLELATPGENINAAVGLLNYAAENAVMLEVDRWVLETAITRLHIALAKLGGKPTAG
jgi:EAL domain-containing protein (putative c-di-GMP-specific phosphodiesterase class I)